MAKKEEKKLKNIPLFELQKEIAAHRQKLADLKFELSAGKVKNIKEIKKVKMRIAQLLTEENMRKQEN